MRFVSRTPAIGRWIGVSAVAAGLALSAVPAGAQMYEGIEEIPEMTLRVHESYGPNTTLGVAAQRFADYVDENTGGRIKFEIFWSSALMSATEVAEGIDSGLVDMGMVFPIYNPASFPIANWLIPFSGVAYGGMPWGQEVQTGAHGEFTATSPELEQEFAERGLHVITATAGVAFDMMCTSPVVTLADLQGKRARAAGQIFSREAEAVGMVPVPLIPAEIFEAFERGIVDCVILHPSGYQDFGVMGANRDKYFVNLEFAGWNSTYYSINKDIWDGLPDVAQQILIDGYMESLKIQWADTVDKYRIFSDMMDAGDATPVQPAQEAIDALRAHQAATIDGMLDNVPDSLSNPEDMISRYNALLEKWRGIVSDDLGVEQGEADVNDRIADWENDMNFAPFFDRLATELGNAMSEGM